MTSTRQDTSAIQVVHAEMADLDRLLPAFGAYREFYGLPAALHECRYFLFNRLMNEDSLILLAEDPAENPENPDNPVMLGFAQLYPTFSSLALNQVWILNDLYILPEARRRGVATRLIGYARDFLGERGDQAIVLETAPDNAAAKALYEGLGFSKDDAFDRYSLTLTP